MTTHTIVHRILDNVASSPQAVAVEGTDLHLTYRGMWDAAGRWGAAVRPHVTGPDDVVGVLLPRGPEVVVAHLAAWRSRAGYLPLDPVLPDGRLATILQDAGCRVVVTTPDLASRLPGRVAAITAPAAMSEPPGPEAVLPGPADLAYVIYTSGTTGRPKGVEVEHGSVALLMEWYRDRFSLEAGVRTSMCANLMFDGLVLDEWGTLSAGATLVVPRQQVLADPAAIGGFLEEKAIRHAYLPTPMLERVLRADQRPTGLRTVATGGDRLRMWPGPDFPAEIHNTYGPTEATVLVTSSGDVRAEQLRGAAAASIGHAVPGAEVWLEGPAGQLVTEPGEPGELVIGGRFLARGYRAAPDLTAAAFTVRPDGTRAYRTGDFCAWDENGDLAFLGRRDGQVKLKGYRVELAEIEQAIMAEEGVLQAVAAVVGEGPEQRLIAWAEGAADEALLRRRLERDLPDYMIPHSITFLAGFPSTTSGKVDRGALIATAA